MKKVSKKHIVSKIICIIVLLNITIFNILIIENICFYNIRGYVMLCLNILFIVILYILFKLFKIEFELIGIGCLYLLWNIFNSYIESRYVDRLWNNENKATTYALITEKYTSYKSPYIVYMKYEIDNTVYKNDIYTDRLLYEELSVKDTVLIDYLIKYPQYIRVIDFSPSSEQIRPYLREISNK